MAAIGIMGGTFNPIHIGHIKIAQAAFFQYHLDEIWFMPNHVPGYKPHSELVSGKHRLSMVKIAIAGFSHFKASDYELTQSGNTYTSKTFEGLCYKYPEHTFYFIMGADSLDYFEKWKNPEQIVSYAKILVAPRDKEDATLLQKKIDQSNHKFGGQHFFPILCEKIPCSSHEIRNAFQNHHDDLSLEMQKFLPHGVYTYITEHHLY